MSELNNNEISNELNQDKKWLKMPHTYIVIFAIIAFATLLTWLIPSGTFERAFNESVGRTLVVPDTFKVVEHTPVSIPRMFMAIYDGMVHAADIVFFTFFSYGFMVLLIKVGAFDAGVGAMLRKLETKVHWAMPLIAIAFSLTGFAFGLWEEVYGFIPVCMAISVALGYDPLYGLIAVIGGMSTGYAPAAINPYTVAIAQSIAELPLFSGSAFRIVCYIVFLTVFLIQMCRYGRMVKADPKKSYVYGVKFPFISDTSHDDLLKLEFTKRHKISLGICAFTVLFFAWGAITRGWYFSELSAIFIVMMLVVGFVNKMSVGQTCDAFVSISKEILFAAFAIGLARGILIVLQDGQIIDTICNFFATHMDGMPKIVTVWAMFFFQTMMNFLISSSSGLAVIVMPLMVPLADLLEINRQIAVLAFQFGDGFSNLFWPTTSITICAIAGVPLSRWWKFFAPYTFWMTLVSFIMLAIAVMINYGPF